MTSVNSYRTRIDEAQLCAVLARAGVDAAGLAGWSELDDATYNTAYRIRLSGGRGLVLKVAPSPSAPTLAYEQGIMRTETDFYNATAGILPVPEVVYADFSRDLLGTDLLLMTELPGVTWLNQRTQLDAATRTRLHTELGGLTAALHGIHGTAFGYPQRTLFPTWRAAFTSMMADLLADATRYAAPLPQPVDRIRDLVTADFTVLDEVTTPVLVHFDLWPGNILLDGGRISGLVDGERAFWGDPLAEFISLAPLDHPIEDDPAFLAGYGPVVFDAAARIRLALYEIYLLLIVLVEGGPRGYHGPERDETVLFVTGHLNAALAKLASRE